MWRYGPSPLKKGNMMQRKEKEKQYETKCAWIFLQSWLVGNKGILKGGHHGS